MTDDYEVPEEERLNVDEGPDSVANQEPPPEETEFDDLYEDPGEVIEESLA